MNLVSTPPRQCLNSLSVPDIMALGQVRLGPRIIGKEKEVDGRIYSNNRQKASLPESEILGGGWTGRKSSGWAGLSPSRTLSSGTVSLPREHNINSRIRVQGNPEQSHLPSLGQEVAAQPELEHAKNRAPCSTPAPSMPPT